MAKWRYAEHCWAYGLSCLAEDCEELWGIVRIAYRHLAMFSHPLGPKHDLPWRTSGHIPWYPNDINSYSHIWQFFNTFWFFNIAETGPLIWYTHTHIYIYIFQKMWSFYHGSQKKYLRRTRGALWKRKRPAVAGSASDSLPWKFIDWTPPFLPTLI